jgi:hypothetical protein
VILQCRLCIGVWQGLQNLNPQPLGMRAVNSERRAKDARLVASARMMRIEAVCVQFSYVQDRIFGIRNSNFSRLLPFQKVVHP